MTLDNKSMRDMMRRPSSNKMLLLLVIVAVLMTFNLMMIAIQTPATTTVIDCPSTLIESNDQSNQSQEIEKLGFENDRLREKADILSIYKPVSEYSGSEYGGWHVDAQCLRNVDTPIVFGAGAGMDISWEEEMIKKYNVHAYILDFTPRAVKYVNKRIAALKLDENQITLIPEGLAAEEGLLTFTIPDNPAYVSMKFGDYSKGDASKLRHFPVNTLANHMRRNGISYIDVLKLDIEGAELGLLEQLFEQDYLPFTQLLIEFHTQFFKSDDQQRYSNVVRQLETKFHLIGKKKDDGIVLEYVKIDDIPWCIRPDDFQRHA